MKILDRYILRQFIVSFAFAVVAFITIFILIDFIEKIDDFIDRKATILAVAEFYLYSMPEIVKLITPMAVLMSALFVTGRMTQQAELTAMKSAGISLYRILLPFLIVTIVITGLSIYFAGWVVPLSAKAKAKFEATVLGKSAAYARNKSNLFLQESQQDSTMRLVSIGFYDGDQKICYTVSLQDFRNERLVKRIDADKMLWNDSTKLWRLENAYVRTFNTTTLLATPVSEKIKFLAKDSLALSFTAAELGENNRELDEMTIPENKRFIDGQRRAGFEQLDEALVKYYSKFSFPFSSLIVVIIGVTLSSVKKRGGLALEFGLSLLAGFVYIAFQQTSATLGYTGTIPPLVAAWFANLLFLGVALWLLVKSPK
jgi:lipopolysaccharide export system permease protein